MSMLGTRFFRRGLYSLMLSLTMAAGNALAAELAPFKEQAADGHLVRQMRQGGFVLYMRHGTTDTTKPDRVPSVDLDDCSTQRPLTPDGRKLAAAVGAFIHAARIPVGEVFSSPLCRAKESATAAFGKTFIVVPMLMYSSNMTDEQKVPVVAETRRLLSSPVKVGTNRLLVAHAPNLMDVMGLFPKPEGSVIVIRPLGDGRLEYLASIPPDAWPGLIDAAR